MQARFRPIKTYGRRGPLPSCNCGRIPGGWWSSVEAEASRPLAPGPRWPWRNVMWDSANAPEIPQIHCSHQKIYPSSWKYSLGNIMNITSLWNWFNQVALPIHCSHNLPLARGLLLYFYQRDGRTFRCTFLYRQRALGMKPANLMVYFGIVMVQFECNEIWWL